MKWNPFTYNGESYSLDHLHPFEYTVIWEARSGQPERNYFLNVIFSLHCFSRKKFDGETVEKKLLYSDARETRVFCFNRYEWSKKLPDIINSLENRKCYHTKHGNFFTIDIGSEEYEVYFTLSKSSKKGRVNLFVQSAYVRSEDHNQGRKKKKPIGFKIIVHNTYIKKAIKSPQ